MEMNTKVATGEGQHWDSIADREIRSRRFPDAFVVQFIQAGEVVHQSTYPLDAGEHMALDQNHWMVLLLDPS